MVISQIAGLATAFGTGELSGAGFGPNYTILMKLGYEFFAPRILEEMEKNPNVFFQDTLWFQKFQKQIKLYSDKVMEQTIESLLSIPKKTFEQIEELYGTGGTEGNIFTENLLSNIKGGTKVVENIQQTLTPQGDPWAGWNNFWNAMAARIPSSQFAGGEHIQTTSGTQINTQGSLISLSRIQLLGWRFEDLNNAMSAITKNNSPYDGVTQGIIRDLWNKQRNRFTTATTQKRQKEIETFQKVTIPESRIPQRSTIRPAGQSVRLERVSIIKIIAKLGKKIVQSRKQGYRGPTTQRLIEELKRQQQKLTFLLNNYTF